MIAMAAYGFVGARGWFVGLVEMLVCLSLAGTVVALAAPLYPRAMALAGGGAALVAFSLGLLP